jgi:hypothetical protein
MSMQRGCKLIELKPSEWYCAVTYREHDYDFMAGDYAVYGPCSTEEAAWEAMSNRASNPGESITITHDRVGDRERRLVKNGNRQVNPSRVW